MAEQKQKLSRSRSRKRRSEDTLKSSTLVSCFNCKSKIPSHTVCPVCGYYKKQQLIKNTLVKTKVKTKTKTNEENKKGE